MSKMEWLRYLVGLHIATTQYGGDYSPQEAVYSSIEEYEKRTGRKVKTFKEEEYV